ncbi:MAG: FAD-binding protein, partial [Anaerolineales bacterium]|nr:FAD-binding protein [Anaerolineales bacterium]
MAQVLIVGDGPAGLSAALFLAKNGITQYAISETQKYGHVTYFFNGGREEPNLGEDRELIPSPRSVLVTINGYRSGCLMLKQRVPRQIWACVIGRGYSFTFSGWA